MENITISAYQIPCDSHESDGTIQWDSTTIILVSLQFHGETGIGFSYGHKSALDVVQNFTHFLKENDPLNIPAIHQNMVRAVRNIGLPGIAAHAIAAVDIALCDLKAKILKQPLCHLFGMAKDNVEVYGSGGFISYAPEQTAKQFKKWKADNLEGRIPISSFNRLGHGLEPKRDELKKVFK